MSLGHYSFGRQYRECEVDHILRGDVIFSYNTDKFTHGRLLTCLECGF